MWGEEGDEWRLGGGGVRGVTGVGLEEAVVEELQGLANCS